MITKHSISTFQQFINRFSSRQIMDIATDVGFTRRNDGKLSPITFTKAMTLGTYNISNSTLQTIANSCEEMQEGLSISKEAIYQRMKHGSRLMKEIFKFILEGVANRVVKVPEVNILKQFKNVYICDSTIVKLPLKLKQFYESARNPESQGSVKMQIVLNLLSKSVKSIEIFSGKENDQSYMKKISKVLKAGELAVFDLGYNDKASYKEIIEKDAFFLTRTMSNCAYYQKSKKYWSGFERINIFDILKNSDGIVDKELYIGEEAQKRIKCRFVAIKLPENIVSERVRRLRKALKGKTASQAKLKLLGWNIFITNVTKEKLTPESICEIYRSRWQIEVFIKACKSHLGLKDLGIGGKEQMECILFGRLSLIAFIAGIYSEFNFSVSTVHNRELSILKLFKNLVNSHHRLVDFSKKRCDAHSIDLEIFITNLVKKSLHEIRKRKSTLGKLMEHNLPILEETG